MLIPLINDRAMFAWELQWPGCKGLLLAQQFWVCVASLLSSVAVNQCYVQIRLRLLSQIELSYSWHCVVCAYSPGCERKQEDTQMWNCKPSYPFFVVGKVLRGLFWQTILGRLEVFCQMLSWPQICWPNKAEVPPDCVKRVHRIKSGGTWGSA